MVFTTITCFSFYRAKKKWKLGTVVKEGLVIKSGLWGKLLLAMQYRQHLLNCKTSSRKSIIKFKDATKLQSITNSKFIIF